MTVDSGELFLAGGHAEQYRLDKFNAPSGAFVSQFAQVPSLSYLHQGVAVGHSTGEPEVYVGGHITGTKEGAVAVFDAAGGLQPPPLEGPQTTERSIWLCSNVMEPGMSRWTTPPPASRGRREMCTLLTLSTRWWMSSNRRAGGGEEYTTRLGRSRTGYPLQQADPRKACLGIQRRRAGAWDGEGLSSISSNRRRSTASMNSCNS